MSSPKEMFDTVLASVAGESTVAMAIADELRERLAKIDDDGPVIKDEVDAFVMDVESALKGLRDGASDIAQDGPGPF